MSKQVLDISQMQHLKDLGVDTSKASCYIGEAEWKEYLYFGKCTDINGIPTFTLQDILDLLPNPVEGTKYALTISKSKYHWFVSYEEHINYTTLISCGYNELIDSAYETLCWLIENGYIKTNNKQS